jgi:SAM-dependent methyltransferase
MDDALREETGRLAWAWDRYPREVLDNYLVADVEDPRVNAQSILTRALIMGALFPGRFDDLLDAELRFGICLTWIMQQLREGSDRWSMLDSLENGEMSAFPGFVIATYESLQSTDSPIPDYITEALFRPALDERRLISNAVLETFTSIWNRALASCNGDAVSILEPACGSANDYRYLVLYGLARFLSYSGFDLSRKNIVNARARFREANFFVGNAFQIPVNDAAFDYLFVHDLFEHLSRKGLETAMRECLRVTRKEAWMSFFNLGSIPDHCFCIHGDYHWNTLSLDRIVQFLLQYATRVEVIDIPELIKRKTGYGQHYNPQAKTLVVKI